jgi:hypothetical protein
MVVWTSSVVALWHMDETSGSTMFGLGRPEQRHAALGHARAGRLLRLGVRLRRLLELRSVPSAASMNPGSANFSFTIHCRQRATPPPPPEDWDLIRKGDFTTPAGSTRWSTSSPGRPRAASRIGALRRARRRTGPERRPVAHDHLRETSSRHRADRRRAGVTRRPPTSARSPTPTRSFIGSHTGADWYQGSLDEASIRIQAGKCAPDR